jgi:Cft2 family RNA processing exonuclease
MSKESHRNAREAYIKTLSTFYAYMWWPASSQRSKTPDRKTETDGTNSREAEKVIDQERSFTIHRVDEGKQVIVASSCRPPSILSSRLKNDDTTVSVGPHKG